MRQPIRRRGPRPDARAQKPTMTSSLPSGHRPKPRPVRNPAAMPVSTTTRCAIATECGSCSHINRAYEVGLKEKFVAGIDLLKSLETIKRAQVIPIQPSPKVLGYRTHFKLAVRHAKDGAPTYEGEQPRRFSIGLFKPGTHDVIEIDNCPLHAYPLKKLVRALREELEASPLAPYDEESNTGDVRYLAARVSHYTDEIMLTFVCQSAPKLELNKIVANLRKRDIDIHSAFLNVNAEKTNAIFGKETLHLSGMTHLRERLCDLDFFVSPTSFFQINPWQAERLYYRVQDLVGYPSKSPVAWDLYCGTGQYACLLANNGYRTIGIEENLASVEDAKDNARRNGLEEQTAFVAARCEDTALGSLPDWAKTPELVVVNPSRRGIAPETRLLVKRLAEEAKSFTLIYVSCNVETLGRDLADFESVLVTRQIEGFDMFPHTNGLEWLAVLTR